MITEIQFIVPAVPVAQPRPRATAFGGHARVHEVTHTGKGPTRKPHPIAAFKAAVMHAAQDAYSGPPLDGPLRMDVVFVMPRPKVKVWKTKPMPRYRHTGKPDRDNLDKAVMDALKGLVWVDDSQVCDGRIQKFVASGYEQPHVEVRISTEVE